MSSTTIILPTAEALLASLESEDFYCDVASASSSQAFFRRLARHSLTQQLSDLIRTNPDYAEIVLAYATRLARSTRGAIRSENDAALCASLVALDGTAVRGLDDLLRYLQNSRELALRWATEIADVLSARRVSTLFTVTTFPSASGSCRSNLAGLQSEVTRWPGQTGDDRFISTTPQA